MGPTIKGKDLKHLIRKCFEAAKKSKASTRKSEKDRNHEMAGRWVESLAAALRKRYTGEAFRVFSRGHEGKNRSAFGLTELLHDICVCTVEKVPQGSDLYAITGGVWQIESEVAKKYRDALLDFNKLVLGSAQNKLFVGPVVSEGEQKPFRDALLPAARSCGGNVYVAFIPHPGDWGRLSGSDIKLFQLSSGVWKEIG